MMPLTPNDSLDLAFDPSIIPKTHQSHLEQHSLHLRPLAADDDKRGHIEALSDLSHAPILTAETYAATFNSMKECPDTYFPLVLVHSPTDQIVATATMFMERKFLRNAGLVGHIEDVVVVNSSTARGKGLGKIIIEILTEIGLHLGAYKVILDCDESNVGFYEKCGYFKKGAQMAYYEKNVPVKHQKSHA